MIYLIHEIFFSGNVLTAVTHNIIIFVLTYSHLPRGKRGGQSCEATSCARYCSGIINNIISVVFGYCSRPSCISRRSGGGALSEAPILFSRTISTGRVDVIIIKIIIITKIKTKILLIGSYTNNNNNT